jgi:nucleoside-diphosphate-sugar epimerase
MDTPADKLRIRSSYNLSGISFTPEQLATEIRKQVPNFKLSYTENDPRQAIANSWPKSIDDSFAKEDWGWKLSFDLADISTDMIKNLSK